MVSVAIPVGAELDERSATAAANRARRVFSDAGRDVGREFSDSMAQGMRSGEESIRKSAARASDSYDRMADAAGRVREAEDKLERARSGGNNAQIVSRAEALERARRAEARATREAADAYRDYESAAGSAGSSASRAGQDAGEGFSGGFGGLVATRMAGMGAAAGAAIGAGFATAGVAAGHLLVNGIRDGLANIQLQDQFQAAMGLDAASMGQFANAAGQAYANNFGESLADNLGAARAALQSGLIAPGASDVEVQSVVQQVQGAAGVTGATVEELTRSVTTLMRTGFAGSVSDAMDIIAAGFQQGMDVSGDWLDTINEYGTQFRKLGLDAGEFMTLLKQGLEGGARDTDQVADSLKEFSIRAVDGSKSTKEGFEALGFNAEEMGKRFAEGGESAKVAFGAVLEAIRSTGDAQQQALIWASLFGTQFEDMGDAINRLNLDPAKSKFTDLQGTSDRATKTASDNFAADWETATRTVGQYFSDLKTDLAELFSDIPWIRDLPKNITYAFGGGDRPTRNGPGIVGPAPFTPDASDPANLLIPGYVPTAKAPSAPTGGREPGWGGPGRAPGTGSSPLTDWLNQGATAPVSGPGAPVAGARTPITGADDGGGGAKAKASFDPSQYSVDAIPVPGAMPGMPNAAAIGQVDPQKVFDAETSLMSSRNSVEQARIRVLELEAAGTATAQDLAQARNGVTMAERQYTSAQTKLAEAQQGTWKKMEGAAKSFSGGMDQIGAAIDADFGISKGLPGIVENLVKAAASIAAAPLLGQLSAISQANPIQGGYGLAGIMGAQGQFGPQYTQSQYAQQGSSPSAIGPAMLQPGVGGGQPYGLAGGTDTGGYGSSGAAFPPWVHALEQAFGVKASTYFGHQESDRHEAGYAPNPSGQNRGIDWSGPVGAMQQFADYLSQVPGSLEQVIWQNPNTGSATEIAGGRPQPGYFSGYLGGHQNHVHTRQSAAIPLPGMAAAIPQGSPAAGSYYGPSDAATAATAPYSPSPGPPLPAFGGGGGGGAMAPGMPSAAPFASTATGGIAYPAGPGGGGVGVGGGLMEGAMTAAGGLDMLAPGAGQAAQTGMKLANRAIQFGSQVAGIGVSGLMETFLPSGSPLGSIGNSWFGKAAGAIASARPALPNTAAKQAPANPNAQGQGQAPAAQGGTKVELNYTNQQATEDRAGVDITRNLEATNSPAGVR